MGCRPREGGPPPFAPRDGRVGCVRLLGEQNLSTFIVEALDHVRLGTKCLRSGKLSDVASLPEASRAAEGGDAAFGGYASARQDDDVRKSGVVSH